MYYKNIKPIFLQVMSVFILLLLCNQNVFAADEVKSKSSTPAPGRGIVQGLQNHYHAQLTFYDFNELPIDQKSKNVGLRFVMGSKLTMIRWEIKKAGTKLPVHFHVNEQINFVEQGKIEVYSQGQKYVLAKGQVVVIPPNVPHEFISLEDNTVMVDLQTPTRQDFVNGEFDKVAPKVFK